MQTHLFGGGGGLLQIQAEGLYPSVTPTPTSTLNLTPTLTALLTPAVTPATSSTREVKGKGAVK